MKRSAAVSSAAVGVTVPLLLSGCSFLTGTPSSSGTVATGSATYSPTTTESTSATPSPTDTGSATSSATGSVTTSGATDTSSATVTTAAPSNAISTGPGGVVDPATVLNDDMGSVDGTVVLNLQGTGKTNSNLTLPDGATTVNLAMTCSKSVTRSVTLAGLGFRGGCGSEPLGRISATSTELKAGTVPVVIDVPAGVQYWLVITAK